MKTIGIDQSINSTGICIYDDISGDTLYYIIHSSTNLSRKKKKLLESISSTSGSLINLYYEKDAIKKNDSYIEKEYKKTINLINIIDRINIIIKHEQPDVVNIEGISYGSVGSVSDLAGLNYLIRYITIKNNVKLNIITPTELKKFATGNGGADKDEMVYVWLNCDRKMNIYKDFKIDDIADAYFLAHYKK